MDQSLQVQSPAPARAQAGLLRELAAQAAWRALQPVRALLPQQHLQRYDLPQAPLPRPLHIIRAHGAEICRGRWRLAGTEISAHGAVIFDHADAPPDWLEELHAFDWLFALLDEPHHLWRLRARTLLQDWLERARHKRLPATALRPDITARRLVNWTSATHLLLENADNAFINQLRAGISSQMRLLQRMPLSGLTAQQRLQVCMARAWGMLALTSCLRSRQQALQELAEEMSWQFLPDGGHISRSPACQLHLLGTLLPLRRMVEDAGMEMPAAAIQAVEKALPMLRMMRHADEGLALFHGTRDGYRRLLGQVLEHDIIAGAPLALAPHSGFARLARGGSVALVDVGAPARPLHNPLAALSSLALEFSADGQRIVTSCGTPLQAHPELDTAARLSAAHSLPQLAERDAGTLRDRGLTSRLFGMPLAQGPQVQADLYETNEGILLEASHDAWLQASGFLTRRRLFLSSDGHDLRGEDSFIPIDTAQAHGEEPCTIRFHLHPAVKASMARDGMSIMLLLPDRSAWTFTARNARLELTESLLLAGHPGPRRSRQIILHGTCPATGCQINWRFRRTSHPRRQSPARHQASPDPSLPLQD